MVKFDHLIKDLFNNKLPNQKAMQEVLHTILEKDPDSIQVGAFLVALHMCGEDESVLKACAEVLLDMSVQFNNQGNRLLDTCGTGGDGLSTFNISSASAVIAAACGAQVAKHGNRSVSGNCGSADLFEKAGIVIDLDAAGVAHTIKQTNIGFLFAPKFHPAMAKVAPIRKALGVRTIFNLLGPLINPAYPTYRIIGVFSKQWLEPVAMATLAFGTKHVMVVHAQDGMDEISISSPTDVFEIDVDKDIKRHYSITPEEFGIRRADPNTLKVLGADQSFEMLKAVLAGTKSSAYDATVLNAAVALYVANIADDIHQGMEMASNAIDDSSALNRLNQWLRCSQEYTEGKTNAG